MTLDKESQVVHYKALIGFGNESTVVPKSAGALPPRSPATSILGRARVATGPPGARNILATIPPLLAFSELLFCGLKCFSSAVHTRTSVRIAHYLAMRRAETTQVSGSSRDAQRANSSGVSQPAWFEEKNANINLGLPLWAFIKTC